MKFLHLADLHLGKRVNEFSMIEDQRFILNQIENIIDENKIDAILIAGDVYDKAVPSAEAVELLNDFLNDLARRKLQVFVISGNHDSAERIGFGAELMNFSGVHMSRPFKRIPEQITLEDEYGTINIYMLPFIKPAFVKNYYAEEQIDSYNKAMQVVMEHTEVNKEQRNILIAHQFVSGAKRCESEDLSIGGIDEVSADNFDEFDYVALGHLHGPQKVGREYVRYSGTLLKYSFSEVKHKKAALIVDIQNKGTIEIESILLEPVRDMREISGTYNEIMSKKFYEGTNTDDYIHVTLKDEEEIIDAIGKLRSVYPNIMRLDYDNSRTQTARDYGNISEAENKSELEHFKDLFEKQNKHEMSTEQINLVQEIIESIKA